MLDLILIAIVSMRLGRRCKNVGIQSSRHIVKLVGYWLLCEVLGMLICLKLGYPLISLETSLCAFLLGLGAGYLSYRQSMAEINEKSGDDDNFPKLNE